MKTFIEMQVDVESDSEANVHQNMCRAIWNLFSENSSCPTENDFKTLGRALEVDHEILEQISFNLLHSFVAFGKSNQDIPVIKDENYFFQLEKGIQVEYEHTHNYSISKKIAEDHLCEIPDYYDRLERMETAAKIELNLVDNSMEKPREQF